MKIEKHIPMAEEKRIINKFLELKTYFNDSIQTANIRKNIINLLKTHGLPCKKNEMWHYTDIRKHLKNVDYNIINNNLHHAINSKSLVKNDCILKLINGISIQDYTSSLNSSYYSQLNKSFFFSKYYLKKNCLSDDLCSQINTIFANDGWKINIPDNTFKNKNYIEIQNIRDQGWSHVKFPVVVNKKNNFCIIQRQIGDNNNGLLSTSNDLIIKSNSKVSWIIIHEGDTNAIEFENLFAQIQNNSELEIYIINIGSSFIRQEVNIDLIGYKSICKLYYINILSKNTNTDIYTKINHFCEYTKSTIEVRNVILDDAKGVFQGKIYVDRKAQKSNSLMLCKTFNLSENAEFSVKPELEIFADDVSCSHGSTFSNINNDHLFYLMSRGIDSKLANHILIIAFIDELILFCKEFKVKKIMKNYIDNYIKRNIKF